jgi:aminoglycoside phosphotransferase family enzyme
MNFSNGLETKLEFLRKPESYPEAPSRVETIETHMSWVFLTERYAYKLKKPVRYDFLDFSTIEARHADCTAELSLNRRLAPDVYLEMVPLMLDTEGRLHLDEWGEAIDWLVKMRRLPGERMLDRLIGTGGVEPGDIRRLAQLLVAFYRGCPPLEITAQQYRQQLQANVQTNRHELMLPAYGLPPYQIEAIHAAQLGFLQHEAGLFEQRAGRVVEGHGDLRPEHVCLEASPVVIDCLEFKREFRILDAADELAFLAMECERLGAPQVGRMVFDTYTAITGDTPPPKLIDFYKSCRACLRAKLAVWHTRDHEVPDHAKWLGRAREYLALAEAYIARTQ